MQDIIEGNIQMYRLSVCRALVTCILSLTSARVAVAADKQSAAYSLDRAEPSADVPAAQWQLNVVPRSGAPNVVVILLDDIGFGALSAFGGPVDAPEIERLASGGLRYTRFHVDAACSPTRASLLSGRNAHRIGFGTVTELANAFPGYTGIWRKDAASIAEVLRRTGYSTAAFGKWHNTPYWEINPAGPFDRWPTGLGFQYFYGFLGGADSQWEPSLYRNTIPVEPPATPENGYHLTTDLVDDAIRWLHTHESIAPETPYFLYFATGATHSPHHVPKAWIEKYRGRFDEGWDKLREATFKRQQKLGVVPTEASLTRRPKELPSWNSLSKDAKRLLARQMEVFAAFMAHTDYEIGRLLRTIQEGPQGDNTLILYIAGDNGADGKSGLTGVDFDSDGSAASGIPARLVHVDELGSKLLSNEYAAGWAWAIDTPFQWMKQVASHFGGTRVPLVVSWPSRITDRGGLRTQFSHANDIAATIYEAAGISFPSVVDGVEQKSLDGSSLVYSFDDPLAAPRHRTQVFELAGNRGIYHDGWFAGARHDDLPWAWSPGAQDFGKDRWELYHIDDDFSQAHDLATRDPGKLKELEALFDEEARRNSIYPIGAGRLSVQRPKFIETDRRTFVYHAGLPRIPTKPHGSVLPDFARSHTITSNLLIPEKGAQGVIVSYGSRWGGFVLYIKDGLVVYESNIGGERRDVITSRIPLKPGEAEVKYRFVLDKSGGRANAASSGLSGVGQLLINTQVVGEQKIRVRPGLGTYMGSFGVGRAFGSPVSSAFDIPFEFTGIVEKVEVSLQ